MITLKLPKNNSKVCLQTKEQADFIKDEKRRAELDFELASEAFYWYDLKRTGTDKTNPLPVTFSWEDAVDENHAEGGCYYLLVAENSEFKNAWVYVSDQLFYSVYNLKVGTTYYWCVQRNGVRSDVWTFKTELTLPRFLRIDGISNVRDMGGYKVKGGRIRQGLVYRGGEFETHMHLTESGANELKRIGLKTEIDMRIEAVGKVHYTAAQTLGVTRAHIPCVPYAHLFDKKYFKDSKNFFKTFTNANNFPIYYHCWAGADRTGTFAFVLGAFLGMDLQDLLNEYEITSLSIWGIRSRNYYEFRDFYKLFTELEGETLQEKSRNFLKNQLKLTDKQLSVIYNNLVESDN